MHLRGRGADVIIIDDLQAAQEVDDRKKNAATRAWYDWNIYQRLNDKEGSPGERSPGVRETRRQLTDPA